MLHGFMLDTVIFNRLLANPDKLERLLKFKLYATHVQLDELSQTPQKQKKKQLIGVFEKVDAETLPTTSAAWDVSDWDQAGWGNSDGLYETLLNTLEIADKNAKKKHRDPKNRHRDVLIAETAIRHNLTVLTEDKTLLQTIEKCGGNASSLGYLFAADNQL